jgi:hypothetical protein
VLSEAELYQLLAPVALYPDPLLAELLTAATLPGEIVLANRCLDAGADPNLIDEQPLHPSVKALVRYPVILQWLEDNLPWTTVLGEAFLYQPQEVMDCIQRLRAQAQALGNLQSTPQENVFSDDGIIEILPANPQVVYVPAYEPQVVYSQSSYGRPCVWFGAGLGVGSWFDQDCDWRNHHVIVWHHDHPRPPDWWSHHSSERPGAGDTHTSVWQPRLPASQRPGDSGSHPGDSTPTVIGNHSGPSGTRPGGAPSGVQSTHAGRFGNSGQGSSPAHSSSGSSHSASSNSGSSHSAGASSGSSHSASSSAGSSGSSSGGGRH